MRANKLRNAELRNAELGAGKRGAGKLDTGSAVAGPIAIGLAALVIFLLSRSARAEEDLAPKLRGALVKVHVTSQSWDSNSPWNKARPRSYVQRGVMVLPGLVLTSQGGLADSILIEVSEANSARSYPASLAHIDYTANLALVKIDDPEMGKRMEPLPLGGPITIDDEFEIYQLGDTDLPEKTTGRVQAVGTRGPQLQLTVKTTLSDAGNGQVALKDGKVVGLVIQTRSNRQEGTLLGIETIRRFLEDYDDGSYEGFGSGGLWTIRLLRNDLRAYYEVPDDVHGIAVSRVVPGRTGHGVLEADDVIVSVKGYDLDDEGRFVHPLHGRIHVAFLLYGSTQPGDLVAATILRDGKSQDVKIPIRSWPVDEQVIPGTVYDRRPQYLVIGGLVLLEMSTRSRVSPGLSQLQARARWDAPGEKKRIIFASRVLPDAANKGLDEIGGYALETVNGKKILELSDVVTALKAPLGGFHVFTFDGVEKDFVVKADELATIDERIAETYRIPELRHLQK